MDQTLATMMADDSTAPFPFFAEDAEKTFPPQQADNTGDLPQADDTGTSENDPLSASAADQRRQSEVSTDGHSSASTLLWLEQEQDEDTDSSNGDEPYFIARKLLRRRHIRKEQKQKERMAEDMKPPVPLGRNNSIISSSSNSSVDSTSSLKKRKERKEGDESGNMRRTRSREAHKSSNYPLFQSFPWYLRPKVCNEVELERTDAAAKSSCSSDCGSESIEVTLENSTRSTASTSVGTMHGPSFSILATPPCVRRSAGIFGIYGGVAQATQNTREWDDLSHRGRLAFSPLRASSASTRN